jgi:uncharacterized membrane protein (DUF2068 family)/ribosomal protein L40E
MYSRTNISEVLVIKSMAIQQTQSTFIYCARCKTKNPTGAAVCSNCGFPFGGYSEAAQAALAQPVPEWLPKEDRRFLPGRPGWVTLYSLYLAATGLLTGYIIATHNNDLGFLVDVRALRLVPQYFQAAQVGFYAVLIVTILGLWFMRNWGRFLAILVEAVVIVNRVGFLLEFVRVTDFTDSYVPALIPILLILMDVFFLKALIESKRFH